MMGKSYLNLKKIKPDYDSVILKHQSALLDHWFSIRNYHLNLRVSTRHQNKQAMSFFLNFNAFIGSFNKEQYYMYVLISVYRFRDWLRMNKNLMYHGCNLKEQTRKNVYAPFNWVWTTRHLHDDVIKWKHFPLYWPFVRGIHQSPANSPHKGQWRGALMFYLICAWINAWANNCEPGDLRRHRSHHDVIVMIRISHTGRDITRLWGSKSRNGPLISAHVFELLEIIEYAMNNLLMEFQIRTVPYIAPMSMNGGCQPEWKHHAWLRAETTPVFTASQERWRPKMTFTKVWICQESNELITNIGYETFSWINLNLF